MTYRQEQTQHHISPWHTVNASRNDLLQDVEALRPTVPVHKDNILLVLDDILVNSSNRAHTYKVYILHLPECVFVWTDGGNCVFYDREDMHLFSTGTEPLLSMMLTRYNGSHNGHQHRRESVGFTNKGLSKTSAHWTMSMSTVRIA